MEDIKQINTIELILLAVFLFLIATHSQYVSQVFEKVLNLVAVSIQNVEGRG